MLQTIVGGMPWGRSARRTKGWHGGTCSGLHQDAAALSPGTTIMMRRQGAGGPTRSSCWWHA